MSTCLDCKTSSRGICGRHFQTDNLRDDNDHVREALEETVRSLTAQLTEAAKSEAAALEREGKALAEVQRLEKELVKQARLHAGIDGSALRKAVEEEREACAQAVLDSPWHNDECMVSGGHPSYVCDCENQHIAKAIRSRGEEKAAEACERCDGCGKIADSEDGEPWTVWEELPPGSDIAVRLGVVRPIPCPDCKGGGR